MVAIPAAWWLPAIPPVVTWQSVVDSTVGSVGAAETLYGRLSGPGHRLVLFDVNRHRYLASVQRPQAGELIERLLRQQRGYELDIVGNDNLDTSAIGFIKGPALPADAGTNLDKFIAELAGGLNLWTGPIKLQDGSEYLKAGEVATDFQVWYLPQLLDGMEGQSVSE
mgnify:CR=1 FL=1